MVRARWIILMVAVMLVMNMGIGCAMAEADASSQRQAVIVDLIKLVMDSKEHKYAYDEEKMTLAVCDKQNRPPLTGGRFCLP